MKSYDILDCGHRPFCAEVGDRQISVWKQEYIQDHDDQGHWELGQMLIFETVSQLWIGDNYSVRDQSNKKYAPRYRYPGNTILFYRETSKQYVFVGPIIYAFSPVEDDVIREFYSPIQVSDHECVPYAVGEKFVYFPMDLTYLPRERFDGPDSRKDAISLGEVRVIHPRV